MKRTHTILATITLISVILTSACTAGNANSTTSSVPETAVTTAQTTPTPQETKKPLAETAQTTTTAQPETKAPQTAVTTTTSQTTSKPQETKAPETVAATTTIQTTPAPQWNEEQASGTKYVNTDCYSRKKAVLGAETVKLYSVNDKVTVTAKTDTGYFKLSDGSFIHGDYLSDSKIVIQTTTTTKKAEAPKPATTTAQKESEPKSIYEYPFDLEAIRQVIIDDAVNNYGLVNYDVPEWTPEGSTWFAPLVISYDLHTNIIKRDVGEMAKYNFTRGYMKKGDYFKIYIQDISEDMDIRDENGKLTKAYAIYFLIG